MGSKAECLTTWPVAAPSEVQARYDEEAVLVRRAQAGDQFAFHEIVERYQSKVFSVIHRLLRDGNDAEDIAQEVFAKAFLSIGTYRHQGALLSWLYRITVNECYEHLRRKRVRPLVYEADLAEDDARVRRAPSALPHPEAACVDRDLVLKLLAQISERERTLLLLREVEGLSIDELARSAGMNPNTAKVMLFRARRKLVSAARRHRW